MRNDFGALPVPVRGEGWGEGGTELSRDVDPLTLPLPSPYGRGSRSSYGRGSRSSLRPTMISNMTRLLERDARLRLRATPHLPRHLDNPRELRAFDLLRD